MANLGQLGSKSWSFTDTRIVHSKHSWTIGNPRFLFLQNNSAIVKSCTFEAGSYTSVSGHPEKQQQCLPHQWMLQIVKNCLDQKWYYGFNLVYVPPSDAEKLPDIPVQFELELLNSVGSSIFRSVSEVVQFSRSSVTHGFPKFLTSECLRSKVALESHITVVCELDLMNEQECLSGMGNIVRLDAPTSTLSSDLEAIYTKKELTDVTFVVGNQQFDAHKLILVARSPVLAAMFSVDMQENLRNQVEIKDIEAEVFKELLRFMYTDQVLDLARHAKGLLIAAEKYDLGQLKAMCEQELRKQLTVETVADTLMIADLYNAEHLKKIAINFAWLNRLKVMPKTT